MNWYLLKLIDGSYATGEAIKLNHLDKAIRISVPESDHMNKHFITIPLEQILRMYDVTEEQSCTMQQQFAAKYPSWEAWINKKDGKESAQDFYYSCPGVPKVSY